MFVWLKERKWLLVTVGILLAIGWYFFGVKEEEEVGWQISDDKVIETSTSKEGSAESQDSEPKETVLLVDVKGAVQAPGVYEAKEGERVIDVIAKAGGMVQEADQTKVNLAMKIADEMVVYVPKIGEEVQSVGQVNGENTAMSELNGGGSQEGKVNLNQANLDELQTLPGIGPSKAQAIIDYREQTGRYESIEDLKNVSGIGDKTFEKLEPLISV